jgi:hypothetical protein
MVLMAAALKCSDEAVTGGGWWPPLVIAEPIGVGCDDSRASYRVTRDISNGGQAMFTDFHNAHDADGRSIHAKVANRSE